MGQVCGAELTWIKVPAQQGVHTFEQQPFGHGKRENFITRNVGSIDRGLRVAAGVALLGLGAFGPLGWWGAIGLVPLATGLLGSCPAYSLLGVNTCPAVQ